MVTVGITKQNGKVDPRSSPKNVGGRTCSPSSINHSTFKGEVNRGLCGSFGWKGIDKVNSIQFDSLLFLNNTIIY